MEPLHYRTFRIGVSDLNGQIRGKRLPSAQAAKLETDGARMPLSVLNVDIWGHDIDGSPLVFETGDPDGILRPTERGPMPLPWLATPSEAVPMAMFNEDGTPFLGDPRQALSSVLDRFAQRGWTVMAATEMEFTLVDDSGDALMPPLDPRSGRRLMSGEIMGLDELDTFDAFFTDVYEGAEAMGIPIQSMISECGIGQFEVTLNHQNAMKAADDALYFKFLLRGIARKHGLAATFMAKPYPEDAGNGMHVHFSVVDENGKNVFDNGGPEGTEILQQAVAGCLQAMRASTLIFAPHGPSYDRFAPGNHAPTSVCWAYENRTSALRIPGGAYGARRIEHRVAGGDINPYLMLAAVLGAAIEGIEEGLTPPDPIEGNAYDLDLPHLADGWEAAIDLFATDPFITRCLPQQLIDNMVMTKRQELRELAGIPKEDHWKTYLERV
ncbi:glutamine synthetase family protein [Shimia haliotis]|uniref:Glutamate--putrescine ligase n=1 Tax=Shimia haliotis TaxID=1280847 RepID=A0A1I4FX36_9RHOB|nr:glutamine synthetase family protein [Shimia haliotis]SFL22354.1 glutamate--putrescine ligase [Shimia haliotis]